MPVNVSLEHLGIDEKADQTLGLNPVSIGNRHTDADVLLAAVTMQEGLEGSQQQHEHRHAFSLGHPFKVCSERGRQQHLQTCTAMALLGRTLMIERQLKDRLFTAQQVTPIAQLPLLFPGLHPVALP
ncbi:hypothetical protein PFL603g_06224 [Pseudomonas fluorescens]|uniref:Uncharacterized protein n=1 Tax=Pseudomonas fluorescens TaxID=294 RepID=A0A125QCT3_PSEFL|nr:hypothetical protein PFL603g_06224 [Pseudomonas fluorescens]